ncbi:hypothetical protein R6Q59_006305 [Mikania micrantha]
MMVKPYANISSEHDRLTTREFATYVSKLANKELKRVLKYDNTNACTLQGLRETTNNVKHNRVTLSELFQKTKMTEEKIESKIHKLNDDRSSIHIMKKMMRRTTRSTITTHETSALAEDYLHKILQIINLEALAISQIMRKYVKKNRVDDHNDEDDDYYDEGYRNKYKMLQEDIVIVPHAISTNQTNSKASYPAYATNRKTERWIKSDAECKYIYIYAESKTSYILK